MRRVQIGRFRFPLWGQLLAAAVLIVGSVSTATAASLILMLSDITPKPIPNVPKLPVENPGAPQNFLVLGSDRRAQDEEFRGNSDTTMLVRLDPDRGITVLSLPRDLLVSIPGHGSDKLNAAYSFGGPVLTLRTVQELTGVDINHVVDVNFRGFAEAVNAIGCVFVDVDHRYFHSNAEGGDQYAEIDVEPGYQALCGLDALSYVRYRHTDNDLVRSARQQGFLREARAKIPAARLFADRKRLISIFTENTRSDIDHVAPMLEVLRLVLAVRDDPIDEVQFEGTLGPSYVTATPGQIDAAVQEFLAGAPAATSPDPAGAAPATSVVPADDPDEQTSLIRTTSAAGLAEGIASHRLKLPVLYPTVLEEGSDFAQEPRVYKVNGRGGDSPSDAERAAYKWVFSRPGEDGAYEYYGFEATRWRDPPILSDPSETRQVGERTYELFYDDDRLRMVAWQTGQGSFWLSNTLTESLTDREMIRIASGMTELSGGGG